MACWTRRHGSDLSLRETLALLCRAEVSHREERRIQMGTGIAKFPHQRTLEEFDFTAPTLAGRLGLVRKQLVGCFAARSYLVVPFAMELVARHVDGCHFVICNGDALRVIVGVEFAVYGQAGVGGGSADQVHNGRGS